MSVTAISRQACLTVCKFNVGSKLKCPLVGICLTHQAAIPSIREWKTILGT